MLEWLPLAVLAAGLVQALCEQQRRQRAARVDAGRAERNNLCVYENLYYTHAAVVVVVGARVGRFSSSTVRSFARRFVHACEIFILRLSTDDVVGDECKR